MYCNRVLSHADDLHPTHVLKRPFVAENGVRYYRRKMDGPQRTYGQLASAALTMLLAIWFAGIVLGWIPRIQENRVGMVIVAIIGPGLIAFQQYRSTFRVNLSAARFCMVLTCCSAVFFTLIFIITSCFVAFQFVRRLQMPPLTALALNLVFLTALISVARSNLHWWLKLKQWHEQADGRFRAHRFTLQEMFLLTLAVGAVFSVARYWSGTY